MEKQKRIWTKKTGEVCYLETNRELLSQCLKDNTYSWNIFPNIFLGKISDGAVVLYQQLRILSYSDKYKVANYVGCMIRISSDQVSQETKRNKRSVLKYLRELSEVNLIDYDRRGNDSFYLFLSRRSWVVY